MRHVSLDSLMSLIMAQNRELKALARMQANMPIGYSMFDAQGQLLRSDYLFPFDLLLIAQLLRGGEMVIFVRANRMPDEFYLVDEPDEGILITDTNQDLPDLSVLAEIACLILWRKDDAVHVVPRDHGDNPLQASRIKITARSPALFCKVIQSKDPTAILR